MMSGQTRLTMCAALASLMTACSLLTLTGKGPWILQAAFLIAVQSTVAAWVRRVPLPPPITVLAQTVTTVLTLTLTVAASQAIVGVIPGPAALTRLGYLYATGVHDLGTYAVPVPVTPGIRLILLTGVVAIALVVDALAVTYGRPAAAGLPLLAVYAAATALSNGGASWLLFLATAGGFLLLLLADGQDRLARAGRVFHGSPAKSLVRSGRRLGVAAVVIALAAPAVLPSPDTGLTGVLGRGSRSAGHAPSATSVNPVVTMQDNLNQPKNRQLLTYRSTSTDPQDLYLRIIALDDFDGTTWSQSRRPLTEVPAVLPVPQGMSRNATAKQVITDIAVDSSYQQPSLPMPFPAEKVNVDGRWAFDTETGAIVGERGQTTAGLSYRVVSRQVRPTAEQLAKAPAPDSVAGAYTRVPKSLPPVVADTARKITAGTSNNYDRAMALQKFFTSGAFRYRTDVDNGTGPGAIERFLRRKQGFCIHYSFTMAAMARTLGIPARVTVGFGPGTPQRDGSVAIGSKDAHAWPELYFAGTGWTRFEPTPSRGSVPEYARERSTPNSPGRPQASRAPSAGGQPPALRRQQDCTTRAQALGECSYTEAASSSERDNSTRNWLIASGVMLLLAGLGSAPLLWRTQQRARRLGGSSPSWPRTNGKSQRAGAARLNAPPGTAEPTEPKYAQSVDEQLAAWRELLDTAWDYGIVPDPTQTPRRAADRLVQETGLDVVAAEAVCRVALAAERVLYAQRPTKAAGLATDVNHVRTALHNTADRRERFQALLMPRSLIRVIWDLSERWNDRRAHPCHPMQRWIQVLRDQLPFHRGQNR
jgi:transglutaminase-like putative cysteine protease